MKNEHDDALDEREHEPASKNAKESDDFAIEVEDASDAKAKDEDADEDEDEAESQEDDRVAADAESEAEEKRRRRREEKRRNREKRKALTERDKQELAALRDQVNAAQQYIEQLSVWKAQTESQAIDQRIAQATQAFRNAETKYKEAIRLGDGESAAQALREREQAAQTYHQANDLKQRAQSQPAPQPAQPRPNPRVQKLAKDFMEEHDWYDVGGQDVDSAIVNTIDTKLMEQGYDPTSEDYWDELREQVRERLPHKFKKAPTRRGPALGSGREAPAGTVKIPKELKEYIIEAGFWDDPKARNRIVKRYLADKKSSARA